MIEEDDGFFRLRRSTCECGTRIAWATTQKGKNIPLNDRKGADARANILLAHGITVVVEKGHGLYLSHFADCPIGVRFRQAR